MWEYLSYSLEGVNPAGVNIIRVFIKKDFVEECFFLYYMVLPSDDIIISHAQDYIQKKNDYEQQLNS